MQTKCPKCGTQIELGWLSKGGKSRWKGVSSKARSAMAYKGWVTRRGKKNQPASKASPKKTSKQVTMAEAFKKLRP